MSGYYVLIFTIYAILVIKAYLDLNLKARKQNLCLVPQIEYRLFRLIKMPPPVADRQKF